MPPLPDWVWPTVHGPVPAANGGFGDMGCRSKPADCEGPLRVNSRHHCHPPMTTGTCTETGHSNPHPGPTVCHFECQKINLVQKPLLRLGAQYSNSAQNATFVLTIAPEFGRVRYVSLQMTYFTNALAGADRRQRHASMTRRLSQTGAVRTFARSSRSAAATGSSIPSFRPNRMASSRIRAAISQIFRSAPGPNLFRKERAAA